jgi:hypothetical protein
VEAGERRSQPQLGQLAMKQPEAPHASTLSSRALPSTSSRHHLLRMLRPLMSPRALGFRIQRDWYL